MPEYIDYENVVTYFIEHAIEVSAIEPPDSDKYEIPDGFGLRNPAYFYGADIESYLINTARKLIWADGSPRFNVDTWKTLNAIDIVQKMGDNLSPQEVSELRKTVKNWKGGLAAGTHTKTKKPSNY